MHAISFIEAEFLRTVAMPFRCAVFLLDFWRRTGCFDNRIQLNLSVAQLPRNFYNAEVENTTVSASLFRLGLVF